jgi:hypothetical protein
MEDRQRWMYRTSRVDPSFMGHVREFVAVAKKYHLSVKQDRIVCPCNSCKNKYAQLDDTVQCHLIRYGFVNDYTVWKYHGESGADASVGTSGDKYIIIKFMRVSPHPFWFRK